MSVTVKRETACYSAEEFRAKAYWWFIWSCGSHPAMREHLNTDDDE